MNRPKIFKLLKTLLDSTPLPRDVLEYIIVPDLLPSPDIARQKMKSVMRSLQRLDGCICTYCQEMHVSVTKIKRNYQPFAYTTIPYCKDCSTHHQRLFAQWNRRSKKNLNNHFFNQYRPQMERNVIPRPINLQAILGQILGVETENHLFGVGGGLFQ